MRTTERFEVADIDRLVPYARNARTHSKEQILQLVARCASLACESCPRGQRL